MRELRSHSRHGAMTVMSGASAGAICWFMGGTTDSFGPELRLFNDGLGLLPYSYSPHYNTEELRRPTHRRRSPWSWVGWS